MQKPGRFYQNNLYNSLHLAEMTVEAEVKFFVLSSKAAVYQSSDEPLKEESALGLANVFEHVKLVIEQTLDWYRQIYGLHYAALPGRDDDYQSESHLIPRVLSVPLGQLESLEDNDRLVYNPGSGCLVREVIEAAREVTDHPIPAKEFPRRSGDPAGLVASAEKIKSKLLWVPQHQDIKAILRSA